MSELIAQIRPSSRGEWPRGARLTSWLRAPLFVVWASFAASTVLRSPSGYNVWLDAVLYNASFLIAAVICIGRGTAPDGLPWLLLGGGLGVFAAASFYSSVWLGQGDVVTPSLADAMWLSFYPLTYLALVVLIRQRVQRFHASMMLDGAVAGLGSGAVVVAFLLGRVLGDTHGMLAEVATNLAYPTGDVLLLVMTVGTMALLGWRPNRVLALLGLGFLSFAVADTVFLFQDAKGIYSEGGPLDMGWPLAAVLIGFAAVQRRRMHRIERFEGGVLVVVPVVFSAAALGLIGYDQVVRDLPTTAVALALATIVASLARFSLTLRELQALSNSRQQARTDELTGLGNRRLFFERVTEDLVSRPTDRPLSVLLVDLDRFKEVNDSLGHHVGDRLLKVVGARIDETLRPQDLVARLGGDEFAVVIDGDSQDALHVADRLREMFDAPFEATGIPLHVGASIGISRWPEDGATANDLLAHADVAMYRAKELGTRVELYVPGSDLPVRERLHLLGALRTGLKRDEIVVHFQPKVDLRTGLATSVEALVRWKHPTRGLLYPSAFLLAAEQSGLLAELTSVVATQAADRIGALKRAGFDLDIAINVSAASLGDADFPDALLSIFAAAGVGPEVLTVEVTEQGAMRDWMLCAETLGRLKDLGTRISIDDYGTGQSSLAYLREFPADELKLDRSYVSALVAGDVRTLAIVRSTVVLAHELGIRVVAEGVESAETLCAVADLGCDDAQGFYLCKPLAAAQLDRWLTNARQDARAGRSNMVALRDGASLATTVAHTA